MIKLYHGDALAFLPTLQPASVDLLLADPPYSSGGAFRDDRVKNASEKYQNTETEKEYPQFMGDSRDQMAYYYLSALWMGQALRVLKPGAFFALTEHGLGPVGEPHHPVPWSSDGSGAYLMRPADTVAALAKAGFVDIEVTDTGEKYLRGYKAAIELAEKGQAPIFGNHILLGKMAPQIVRNAARNIEEHRTHPVQIVCRKPS